ncbi:MAG: ABC transporter ATP-binding protein, partial [Bacteroides sp.]|nr:ABC transporter ATP-binding protein [Bacteroides sp.]
TEQLTFYYGRSKKAVLDDFSLELGTGMVCGLLGKNGVGKSTLLYLMMGLLTAHKGKIKVNGIDVRKRLPVTLKDTFLVPEEFDLPPISLFQFVELNSPFYPNFSKEDLVRYLHYFEMDFDIHLKALSMGQKKKVFMSFALATNTSILLMDEPTNGLDIPAKSQFRKLIASGMNQDRLILISSHQVRDIDKILDHVLIMDKNHLLLDASTEEICKHLFFMESDDISLKEQAIYHSPSVKGNYLLMENSHQQESELNLEVLFNATLAHPERMESLFNVKS